MWQYPGLEGGRSIMGGDRHFCRAREAAARSTDTSARWLQRPITAGEQGSMPQRFSSVMTSTRATVTPRHLASGDASVTIHPRMLARAQRVSQISAETDVFAKTRAPAQ